MKPVRIQRKRTKGFNLQAESKKINGLEAVYVGRGSKWGNPVKVIEDVKIPFGDKVYSVFDIPNQFALNSYSHTETGYKEAVKFCVVLYKNYIKHAIKTKALNISELKGKNLACWCGLDEPCHGDILLKIVNKENL